VKISIICEEADRLALEEVLWSGRRHSACGRPDIQSHAEEDFKKVKTKFGEVRLKTAYYKGKEIKAKPEYEDCTKLAPRQRREPQGNSEITGGEG